MSNPIKIKAKLVKPGFEITLKKDSISLADHICDLLKNVDLTNMKLDPEFIKYVSELIENQISKNPDSDSPNKLTVFIEVMKKLFPNITDSELKTITKILEFLLKNKLVQKTKLSKIFTFYLKKKFGI